MGVQSAPLNWEDVEGRCERKDGLDAWHESSHRCAWATGKDGTGGLPRTDGGRDGDNSLGNRVAADSEEGFSAEGFPDRVLETQQVGGIRDYVDVVSCGVRLRFSGCWLVCSV